LVSLFENSHGAISAGGIEPIDYDTSGRFGISSIDAFIDILILDVHDRPHQSGGALSRSFVFLVNSSWPASLLGKA
jgi:hypothetical protein